MTLEAVALDLGHAPAPTFALLDASGLASLVLPETLVSNAAVPDDVQALLRQPAPDAVRRFTAAMNVDTMMVSPFRVVVSAAQGETQPTVLTAGKPKMAVAVEKPAVAVAEKPVASATNQPVDVAVKEPVAVVADAKPVVQGVNHPMAPTTAMPSEKTAVVENPVAVEPAEKPVVVVAEKPASSFISQPVDVAVKKPVAVVADAKPVVQGVDHPMAPTTVMPSEKAAVVENPVVVAPAEKPVVAVAEKPVVEPSDNPEEKAVSASAHVIVASPAAEAVAPQSVQPSPDVAAVSAASARTEAIVETVNQVVEAVVGQIIVTPGIEHGECEIKITLKPTVLDGSEIAMSAKDGALIVHITPATQEASAAAAAALPRLEIALAEHAPAFRQVSVALALKKGKSNEAV